MSDFKRDRDHLIAEIAENFAKCITSVNQLNRNIESVTIVGAGFEPVNNLWKQFENVMGEAKAGPKEQDNQIHFEPPLPEGTDETAVLPAGIAPGGGEILQKSTQQI
ncbi:hypothetical protein T439DRAFT_324813 [Meredithblackwellia eburnea MCA 4105]